MVDRDEIKAFLRFLDEGSDRELREREKLLVEMAGVMSASDSKRDVSFLLRLLREEKAARLQIAFLDQQRRLRQVAYRVSTRIAVAR